MNIKSLVEIFNRLFPKPSEFSEEDRKTLEKEIVSRYAQGNISLHFGSYITSNEVSN
jgi:hypothetical protein